MSGEAGFGQYGCDHGWQARITQLQRRDVARQRDVIGPSRGSLASLAHEADRHGADQASVLGDRDELHRRHQPAGRMRPARQHLEADESTRFDVHQRLEERHDGMVENGLTQLTLKEGQCANAHVGALFEEAETASALGLGAV